MTREVLSLNFMYCMERLATQEYGTQRGCVRDKHLAEQLKSASANERQHSQKLHAEIKKLNSRIYPFGPLFQLVGGVLGLLTALSGKRNLLKANVLVENRAVKDYNGFLRSVAFDSETVELLKGIIADEEHHIATWKKDMEPATQKVPAST